jgi:8-oxo-dGTP pyrophosphatase MutT (NUDIX family)
VSIVLGHGPGTLVAVETLGSKQVYANPWMTVREDVIRRSDGSTGIYGVVDSPDIALVIPSDGDRLQLVEQYRHPVAGRRWEFPSGSADQRLDTDPTALAARELREETGLSANRLTPLGTLDVTPSTFSQRCSVFLATDLTYGAPQRELEEQDMRSAWFTRAEVERMISDGTITDAKSVAAYTLLLLHAQTSPD